jgi:hypothetical protein
METANASMLSATAKMITSSILLTFHPVDRNGLLASRRAEGAHYTVLAIHSSYKD